MSPSAPRPGTLMVLISEPPCHHEAEYWTCPRPVSKVKGPFSLTEVQAWLERNFFCQPGEEARLDRTYGWSGSRACPDLEPADFGEDECLADLLWGDGCHYTQAEIVSVEEGIPASYTPSDDPDGRSWATLIASMDTDDYVLARLVRSALSSR